MEFDLIYLKIMQQKQVSAFKGVQMILNETGI